MILVVLPCQGRWQESSPVLGTSTLPSPLPEPGRAQATPWQGPLLQNLLLEMQTFCWYLFTVHFHEPQTHEQVFYKVGTSAHLQTCSSLTMKLCGKGSWFFLVNTIILGYHPFLLQSHGSVRERVRDVRGDQRAKAHYCVWGRQDAAVTPRGIFG